MTLAHRDAVAALAPLMSALTFAAERDARAEIDAARAEADRAITDARAKAEHLLEQARTKGTADGEAVLAADRSRAEREARGIVLKAKGDAFDASRRAARTAVGSLTGRPEFGAVDSALRSRARATLGDDVRLTEADSGGIIATSNGRRLDLSLDSLADDLVDDWPSETEGPWSS